MKKEQKNQIKEAILLLEEETQQELFKLKELKETTRNYYNKCNKNLKEEEEKLTQIYSNFTIRERIEWKQKNQAELNKSIETKEKNQEELKIINIIMNITDEYINNIYNLYANKIYILILKNIKNSRDLNDFLKYFDYDYNREEKKYIYNNICKLYKDSARAFCFNFNEKTNILPFKDQNKKIYIYTQLFDYNYNKYGVPAEFNQNFIEDSEAVKKEIENTKKSILEITEKNSQIINNYYDLKKYIENLQKINNKYNEKMNELQKEQSAEIEKNDILKLESFILKGC